jgi:hypothetical protein
LGFFSVGFVIVVVVLVEDDVEVCSSSISAKPQEQFLQAFRWLPLPVPQSERTSTSKND